MTHKLTRLTALMLAIVMTVSMLLIPVEAASFRDVSDNAWYSAAVDYVHENGWMAGVSETSFAPNLEVTRGMFVTVLARYAQAETDNGNSAFTDTPAGSWFTGAAAWAAEQGLASGVGGGKFAPNRVITRQDLCAILYKYIEKQELTLAAENERSFTDFDAVSDYARDAVSYCAAAGLVAGYDDGSFHPTDTATRAQLAAILMRLDLLVKGEEAPTEPMPAQSFEGGEESAMTVSVEAPEGALPENTQMTVKPVTDEAVLYGLKSVVNGPVFAAADISFVKDGMELEPKAEVEVQLGLEGLENLKNPTVVHIRDDGSPEIVNSELISTDRGGRGKALRFMAKDFSVYAVTGGISGDFYNVTVEFYARANGSTGAWNRINRQIIRSDLLTGAMPVTDPGVPSIKATQSFEGWFRAAADPTAPFGDNDAGVTIAEINETAKAQTGAVTLKYYAMVFDVVYITYHDQAGNVLETEANHLSSGSTLNKYFDKGYIPFKGDQKFFGWTPESNVARDQETNALLLGDYPSYVSTEDGAYYPLEASEPARLDFSQENDLHVYPFLAQGHWLIFDNNLSGNNSANGFEDSTSASYTAPKLFMAGRTLTNNDKPSPTRTGYEFGGWYSDQGMTRPFSFSGELSADTTIYAKWTPTYTTYYVNIWVQSDADRPDTDASNNTYDFLYQYSYENKKSGDPVSISASSYSLSSVLSALNSTSITNAIGETEHYTVSSNCVLSAAHIAGDKSTTLDVKYDRERITMNFYDADGSSINSSNTNYYYRVNDGAGDYKLNSSASPSGFYLVGTGPKASSSLSSLKTLYYHYYYSSRPSSSSSLDKYFEENLTFYSVSYSNATSYSDYYYYRTTLNSSYIYYPLYYYYNNDSAYVADTSEEANYRLFNGKMVGLYGARVYGWPEADKYGSSSSAYYLWYTTQGAAGTSSTTDCWMTIPMTSFKYIFDGYPSLDSWNWFAQTKSYSSPNYVEWYTQDLDGSYKITAEGLLDGTVYYTNSLFYGFHILGYSRTNSYLGNTVSNPSYTSSTGGTLAYSSSYDYANLFYERNKWTISYFDGSSELTSLRKTNVLYETDISSYDVDISDQAREGYYFEGWYKDPTCKERFDWNTTMPNSNVTVYAKWTKLRFRVVLDYNADGDTIRFPGNQADSFRLDWGEQVEDGAIMAAERDGYVLLGWYYTDDNGKEQDFNFAMGANESMADMSYGNRKTNAAGAYTETQAQYLARMDSSAREGQYQVPGVTDKDTGTSTWSDRWTAADPKRADVRGYIRIYAKWRENPDGLTGVKVKYFGDHDPSDTGYFGDDAVNGPHIWDDPYIYTNLAEAYAQAASTPDNTREAFLYWEIVNELGEVVKTVYPGQTFTVQTGDAHYTHTLKDEYQTCEHENAVLTERVEPTCAANGHDAYWYCPDCDRYFTNDNGAIGQRSSEQALTIPALGHNWGAWTDLPDHSGHTHSCSRCDAVETAEHNMVETAYTAPNTTSEGSRTMTCSDCGYSHTETLPVLTGYTVEFSVPAGLEAPESMFCEPEGSITLPTAPAPEGYSFVGWVENTVSETTENTETVYTGSYPATRDITLKALYTRTAGENKTVYQLISSIDDVTPEEYVITSGITVNDYMMAATTSSYYNNTNGKTLISTSGAAISSTNPKYLENVPDANKFKLNSISTEGYTDYFAIYASANSSAYYLSTNSTTDNNLTTNTTLYQSGIWKPESVSSGKFWMANGYMTTYALCYNGTYFNTTNTAGNGVYLWKKTSLSATTYYTTEIETYTVTYSVPAGVNKPASNTVPVGGSVTLPAEPQGTPEGYSFRGWAAAEISTPDTSVPELLTSPYTHEGNVTLYAVYSYTEGSEGSVFQLLTAAPSDWAGNYVITNNSTTTKYVFTGVTPSSNGAEIEVAGNATTLANSGITATDTELTNVADAYVVTLAASGNYYTVQCKSTGTYVGMNSSSYLSGYTAVNTSYCRWTPAINASGVAQLKNAANGSYPYFGFSTSSNYFWAASSGNANVLQLWKETQSGTTYYTTVIEGGGSNAVTEPEQTRGSIVQDQPATVSNTRWVPYNKTEIDTDKEYLIGISDNGTTYLALNYNPAKTNKYYYEYAFNYSYYGSSYTSENASYLGYTGTAVMEGENVSGISGDTTDLKYAAWKFVRTANGYSVVSAYESNRYLQAEIDDTTYFYWDEYPKADSSSVWVWNPTEHSLKVYGSNVYTAIFQPASNGPFYLSPERETGADTYVQLYVKQVDHTLTVNYAHPEDSSVTWPQTHTEQVIEGEDYSFTVPTVEGYTPNVSIVQGTMGGEDITVTVTYTKTVVKVERWHEVNTIDDTTKDYLIGVEVNGKIYLLVNYNVTAGSSSYSYNGVSYTYLGLAAFNGNILTGVSGAANNLDYCRWNFSDTTGGIISSARDSAQQLYFTGSGGLYPDSAGDTWTWMGGGANTMTSTGNYAWYLYGQVVNGTYVAGVRRDTASATVHIYREVEDEQTTYDVSFQDEDGNAIVGLNTLTVTSGTKIAEPAAPEKAEYFFLGWFDQQSGEEFNFDVGITRDTVLVARYDYMYIDTYTVWLRAVYGVPNTTGLTHIYWYENDGSTVTVQEGGQQISFGAGAGDRQEHEDIEMNVPVDIPTPSSWTGRSDSTQHLTDREDRVFLGWARLNVTGGGASGVYRPDLTEENLFLKWSSKDNQYLIKNEDGEWVKLPTTQGGYTYGGTYGQVYADETQPYHDMYAVWATYAYVLHSSSGKMEAVRLRYSNGEQLTENLVRRVPSSFLYGGYYNSYGGAADLIARPDTAENSLKAYKAQAMNKAFAADVRADSESLLVSTGAEPYTGASMKTQKQQEEQNFWKRANAYKPTNEMTELQKANVNGERMLPQIGQVYYLKEVPASYLVPKLMYVYDKQKETDNIKDVYLVTALDDTLYGTIGYQLRLNEKVAPTVEEEVLKRDVVARYFSITEDTPQGLNNPKTLYATDFTNVEGGVVSVRKLTGFTASRSAFFTDSPAWITLDGVTVNNAPTVYTVNAQGNGFTAEQLYGQTLYLNVGAAKVKTGDNATAPWADANAITRVYLFNADGSRTMWLDATVVDADNGIYSVNIPDGPWTGMNIVRQNPAYPDFYGFDFNNHKTWAQTSNIPISGKLLHNFLSFTDGQLEAYQESWWSDYTP